MLNKLGAKVTILTKYYIIGIRYTILGMQVCKGTCASIQRYVCKYARYVCKYAKEPKRSGNCNTELANSLVVRN